MRLKNAVILIFALVFLIPEAKSQNIEDMAGIRLGGTTALTYKKMFGNLEAVEMMLSGRDNGIQIIGLFENHKPMATGLGENFYAYYGFGGHIGYLQSNPLYLRNDSIPNTAPNYQYLNIKRQTFFTMGLDAIVGVEYHIYSIPMAVSMDFKPYVELIGMRHLRSRVFDFGVSAKYIF